MTALLTEPFGYGTGDSIRLTCAGPVDVPQLTYILEANSCYPPAIPKIIACLAASHRYDCVVQYAWFRNCEGELRKDLAKIGVKLETVKRAETWRYRGHDKFLVEP